MRREKKNLEEFDKLMEKQNIERKNYQNKILERAILQDKRQKLMKNIKDVEKEIENDLNRQYCKEREEIDKRNEILEDIAHVRKKELLEEMKTAIEHQKEFKKSKEEIFQEEKKLYGTIIKENIDNYTNEKIEKEKKRRNNIMFYKNELDKQIMENNLLKFQQSQK